VISIIVIGVDPSETGERAFRAGVELAEAVNAQVHLVTAFVDGPSGGVEITPQRREAERVLEDAASKVGPNRTHVRTHAIPEKPADAIMRVATETNADVIVIGNRGAQGTRRVLGSVASAIVGHAPCDVLVVKTS